MSEHETVESGKQPEETQELAKLEPEQNVVTPDQLQQQIETESKKRQLITKYISDNLVEGRDYYTIEMYNRKTGRMEESKPSLSKAGSEKFLNLFNWSAKFERDDETWEMLGKPAGVVCYVCRIVNSYGRVVGEGRGARDTKKDGDSNKSIKMAQKSAQIDAVMRVGALSDSFAQDLEDIAGEAQKEETPKPSPTELQKRRIVQLLSAYGFPVAQFTKEDYEKKVEVLTDLSLVEVNYPEIISRLEALLKEKQAAA